MKDWKKESEKHGSVAYVPRLFPYKSKSNKYAKRLFLMPFEYSNVNKWQVLISNYHTNKIKHDFFKTKAAALKHAKAYMRKN